MLCLFNKIAQYIVFLQHRTMFNITENCSKKTVILMQNLVQNYYFYMNLQNDLKMHPFYVFHTKNLENPDGKNI